MIFLGFRCRQHIAISNIRCQNLSHRCIADAIQIVAAEILRLLAGQWRIGVDEGRAIPFGNFQPILIVLLSGLLCYGLSNLISHSATAALLMPILVVVCTAMGDKLAAVGGTSTVLIGVAIASSSAMILPISTPPNALAYATNMIQQKDMARMGLLIGFISIVLGYLVLFAAGSLHIV